MGQALLIDDATDTRARPARSVPPESNQTMLRHATTRVPMLDWPAQLFNDNATMGELVAEDMTPANLAPFAYGVEMDLRAAA